VWSEGEANMSLSTVSQIGEGGMKERKSRWRGMGRMEVERGLKGYGLFLSRDAQMVLKK